MSAAFEMPLRRVEIGSSAQLLAKLIRVLFPDADTVLDVTYGNGKFWTDASSHPPVTGMDIDPSRARDIVADFTRLPFRDEAFSLCIFDPPYNADAGQRSVIGSHFGTYRTTSALRGAVEAGAREAWRVARLGVIVKVQDQIHNNRLTRMTRWVEDVIPMELYDLVHLEGPGQIEDPKWTKHGPQISVRSNATTWLVWRKDGPVHKRRSVRVS